MIAIFAIILVGLAAYRPLCAPFFLARLAMKVFPPVHLLTDIRLRWESEVTEQAARCSSAPEDISKP
jgi:hypothetical protein